MSQSHAPYRADEVGSLLRTAPLKEARAKREKGEITPAQLKAVEDAEIKKIIAKQEDVGLQLATDGEFRRSWWHFDFFWHLTGCERVTTAQGIQFHGVQTKAESLKVTGRLDFPADHPMIEHFKFLKANTKVTPKMTIPSPSVMHFRGGRSAIAKDVYPEMGPYFEDLGKLYGKAIKAFYDVGCRYLQLDDTSLAYLNDPDQRAMIAAQGADAEHQHEQYIRNINAAIKDRPASMRVTTHMCRGNFRSSWAAEGGYDFVAEALFSELDVDGFFLEFDDERSGGFEPLRFVPEGKQVVLGLVTTKNGRPEDKDTLKRRVDEASRYVPLEQLCLSPQCGFSSTVEGNVLTVDEEIAKLRLIVETAQEIWG